MSNQHRNHFRLDMLTMTLITRKQFEIEIVKLQDICKTNFKTIQKFYICFNKYVKRIALIPVVFFKSEYVYEPSVKPYRTW